jgi:hypothetical protein
MDMDDEVSRVVLDAWRAVLDLPDAAAGRDFFGSGGTSFDAITMMEAVEARLGIEFPLETLFLDSDLDAVVRECQARYAAEAGHRDNAG